LGQSPPVASWGFQEGVGTTAADGSGNGNTGTLLGPTWTIGAFGNGLTFDGVNDRVQVADSSSVDILSAITISAWVKFTPGKPWNVVVLKESASNDHTYALWISPTGQITAAFALSDGARGVSSPDLFPADTWTYVTVTYDGVFMRLYLNAVEVATNSASGTFANTAEPLWIGGDQWAGDEFTGSIDEVRLYDRALTVAEIQNDMSMPVDPTSPLQVTQVSPAAGAVGIRNTPITATFSAVMNSTTLSASNVILETTAGASVSANRSYDTATRTVTITPVSALTPLTDYRVRVVGGSTGVASAWHNDGGQQR
jgi:hypothetical protein